MATPNQNVCFLNQRKQDIQNMFNNPGSEDAYRASNIFDAYLIGLLCAMVTEGQWRESVQRAHDMTRDFAVRNFTREGRVRRAPSVSPNLAASLPTEPADVEAKTKIA